MINLNLETTCHEQEKIKAFRITGYYPAKDVCFIADSNGLYKEIWEFSAALISKGVKVLEVGNDQKFKYGNIEPADADTENIILRACAKGQPKYINGDVNINGKCYTPKHEIKKTIPISNAFILTIPNK